mmetsp:Transcript_12535/g.18786  ORF Transcript_12535/g.18786 Transcript_12535/m.18786 type:complete len:128 (-) Transcript_12535:413-796(-)
MLIYPRVQGLQEEVMNNHAKPCANWTETGSLASANGVLQELNTKHHSAVLGALPQVARGVPLLLYLVPRLALQLAAASPPIPTHFEARVVATCPQNCPRTSNGTLSSPPASDSTTPISLSAFLKRRA